MSELPRPAAKRLRRPSWRDSRLLVGVLLVLLAATLGARAVAAADDRVPVWVAAGDLVAGDAVGVDGLRAADVRLADDMDSYLAATSAPPPGSVVLRDVRAGELLPRSAVGTSAELDVQRVTVSADTVSTTGLVRGSRVDLYVTPKTRVGAEEPPGTTRVLRAAGVAAVAPAGGGFGANATTSVQLFVPTASVQDVVEAVDGGAKLTLVPVAGASGS